MQEQVSALAMGNIPRAITVILEDDLVAACKVRAIVFVNKLCAILTPLPAGRRCDCERRNPPPMGLPQARRTVRVFIEIAIVFCVRCVFCFRV